MPLLVISPLALADPGFEFGPGCDSYVDAFVNKENKMELEIKINTMEAVEIFQVRCLVKRVCHFV